MDVEFVVADDGFGSDRVAVAAELSAVTRPAVAVALKFFSAEWGTA